MSQVERSRMRESARELVKLTLVSSGTYLSTHLVLRLIKNPLVLFATGIAVGIYANKNRSYIVGTLIETKHQATDLLKHDTDAA